MAVIVNQQQQVLLALRHADQHQGNLWEFPGGKVKQNESVYDALVREIDEEVGLVIHSARQLVKVSHDYGDKTVLLDVWYVDQFSGKAQGREGQDLRWCALDQLRASDFPAANIDIISVLQRGTVA